MRKRRQYNGFSLTEVLLAVGTLAIGMVFISGTFLTGIYFSTISTERSIAAVVADEAFAKVRLHGIDLTDTNLAVNQQIPFESLNLIAGAEFAYPSTRTSNEKHYYWSALCRPVYSNADNRLVQVTVFICRKVGSATTYPPDGTARPVPVQVGVTGAAGDRVLAVTGDITFINDGYTIVENGTGQIYRVVERGADPARPEQITLAREKLWQGGDSVWVVPPPVGGGKNPCIAVYQKIIRF
jgi:type II secretory pathway pseudopilin PulG